MQIATNFAGEHRAIAFSMIFHRNVENLDVLWSKGAKCFAAHYQIAVALDAKLMKQVRAPQFCDWLFERGVIPDQEAMFIALSEKSEIMVKWLISHGVDLTAEMLECAASLHHFKILRALIRAKCPMSSKVMENAMESQSYFAVCLLLEAKCPLSERVFTLAVEWGEWRIMNELYKLNCPWNELTFAAAAELPRASRAIRLMKWLRARECPWDGNAYRFVEREVEEWLREQGCPEERNIEEEDYEDDEEEGLAEETEEQINARIEQFLSTAVMAAAAA